MTDATPTVPPATTRCPRCATEFAAVPGSNPQCPACLLQLARTPLPTAGPALPPIAELQPLFPGYELQTLLGRGGMGAVYRARHDKLDRLVALKILLPDLVHDPAFAERFEREAKALARLHHPGIVGVHDFGRAGPFFFLVMEFVDGANLRDLLAQGHLSPRDVLAFVPQLCDALQYAHDHRIVHRDIKPENILIDSDSRVRVADFGLAKLIGAESRTGLTQTRQGLGTPHYMAPEQVHAAHQVDHRADLYSLGVVLYEMLTGELPIGRFQPPSAKASGVRGLDPVVMKSLENDPAQRYQAASEVKRDVQSVAHDPANPPPPLPAATSVPHATAVPTPPHRDSTLQQLATLAGACFAAILGESFLPWVHLTHGVAGMQMSLSANAWKATIYGVPGWAPVAGAAIAALLAVYRFFGGGLPFGVLAMAAPGTLFCALAAASCANSPGVGVGPGMALMVLTLGTWCVVEWYHLLRSRRLPRRRDARS